MRPEPKTFPAPASLAFLCVLWLAFLAVRLTAPSDLMDNDQERPAAYVLDCVRNGHWACQRDSSGEVMSKPPLSTWLAALTTLAAGGRASLIALYLPGALSVLAGAILLYFLGGAVFRGSAGFWAAFAYLVSMTSYKQLALARTDPVFTFAVFLPAFLAFRHGPPQERREASERRSLPNRRRTHDVQAEPEHRNRNPAAQGQALVGDLLHGRDREGHRAALGGQGHGQDLGSDGSAGAGRCNSRLRPPGSGQAPAGNLGTGGI